VFTNTIQNPAGTGFIADVTVEPADVALVTATTGAGTLANGDIPDGTVVRITFGANNAYYEYDATTGTWSTPFSDAGLTTAGIPIIIDTSLTAGETQQVTVGINFPSTSGITPLTLPSYPVYLVVFPEDDDVASPGYTNETTYNLTIDRSYPAGFIELSKSARIYTYNQDTGVLNPNATPYSDNPDAYASSTGDIRPQDVIEYRIIYTNISEPASGTGNVVLTGNNFTLTEDGNAGVNDWYTFTLHQFGTDTGKETLDPAYRGTVTYDGSATEPANDADVEVYVNTVTTVAPGISGTFTFKREVQ